MFDSSSASSAGRLQRPGAAEPLQRVFHETPFTFESHISTLWPLQNQSNGPIPFPAPSSELVVQLLLRVCRTR